MRQNAFLDPILRTSMLTTAELSQSCTQTQDSQVLALPSGHALWTEVQLSLNLY